MFSTGTMEYCINNKDKVIAGLKIQAIPVYTGLLVKSGVDRINITNIESPEELDLISKSIRQYFKQNGIMTSRINNYFGRVDFYKLDWTPTKVLSVSENRRSISAEVVDITMIENRVNMLKAY